MLSEGAERAVLRRVGEQYERGDRGTFSWALEEIIREWAASQAARKDWEARHGG